MKIKFHPSVLLFLLSLAMFSCTNTSPNSQAADETMTTDTAAMNAMPDTSGVNNDSNSADDETDALVILNAINQNEIDMASEAQTKNISRPVKDYAAMLHKEHSENLNKTRQLASEKGMTLAETNASTEVRNKGGAELNKLKVLEGKDFQAAYLDAMISGHTEALDKIDNQLMAMATSEDVRQHLTETRGHVAMHLEKAKQLKGSN